MSTKLLIVGAMAARAAACSALRAGYLPQTVDCFADEDLARVCRALRLSDYPAGIAQAAAELESDAWLYTGGMENHPAIVERLAASTPLWGNGGDVLRRVRDPLRVAKALQEAGLPVPDVTVTAAGLPLSGRWLVKPLRSAGGMHVRPLSSDRAARGEGVFYQRRIDGTPCSAVFVASQQQTVLLGATRQLVGKNWTGGGPFQYTGSIGPLSLSPEQERALRRIGSCLTEAFGLRGLFGVDFILDGSAVWPVEVNPRYTASVEIVERYKPVRAIELHANACSQANVSLGVDALAGVVGASPYHGKAIVFADGPVRIDTAFAEFVFHENAASAWPRVADVPRVGAQIGKGDPIITVFSWGIDENAVEQELAALAHQVRRLVASGVTSSPRK